MYQLDASLIVGLTGGISGAFMAMLAFAMSRAPGWRELRSFALVAGAASAYCFLALVHVFPFADDALVIGERLTLAACFLYGLAWVVHLASSRERPLRRWERGAMIVAAALAAACLIPGVMITLPVRTVVIEWFGASYRMGTPTPLAELGIVFILAMIIAATFSGGRRWREGWHSRLPMICAATLVVAGTLDTLGSLEIIEVPQLIEATSVFVVGALGVSYARRFITDAHRLEALSTKLEHEIAARSNELVEAQAKAAEHELLAGLGRIAAGVAHEINNPTAIIQQSLDRIGTLVRKDAALNPEVDLRLGRARAATNRIASTVRQLLEAWRPPSPGGASEVAFALAPVVDKAIAAARVTVPDLLVAVDVDAALCARGEPSALEQALINLFVNAAHAVKDVAGGGRVRVEGVRDGESVRLLVIDNGPGIPPEIRDRLFEPFATTKPVGEGSGLGLAVSRGLLTRQGGTLTVARSTSEGTEMAITLPAAEPEAVVDLAPEGGDTPIPTGARDLRVLIVEDNDDLRELLVLQLDRYFQVDDADTVDKAVEMARETRYDAVVCDLMMPAGGAESWLLRCHAIDATLGDRTIVLTGGPTTETASALVRERPGRVVFKPPEIAELKPLIERIARTSRSAVAGTARRVLG